MKKALTLILAFGFSLLTFADNAPLKKSSSIQTKKNEGGEKCFDEGTHIVNLGFGFGRTYHAVYKGAGYKSGSTPAISLTYEQAWPQKLGPGYLGVGAYLGHQFSFFRYDYTRYNDNNGAFSTYYSDHKWNYFMLAARAAYHWDVLNSKNAEVYGGVIAGLRFQIHNYSTNDPDKKDPYNYNNSLVYPAWSVFAGARWYFSKNVGLFAEVGYGVSYLTGGFSFKF
ncbi:MAG: hypothetical protein JNK50_08490 [Bacteroidia bacterium]|nr:hypothetical protein [Bacteroidia bacterium]